MKHIQTERWMATILDDFGNIYLTIHKRTRDKSLSIIPKVFVYTSKDRLRYLLKETMNNKGTIYSAYICFQSNDAIELIRATLPYLDRLKRPAELLLAFADLKSKYRWYTNEMVDILIEMQQFTRRGISDELIKELQNHVKDSSYLPKYEMNEFTKLLPKDRWFSGAEVEQVCKLKRSAILMRLNDLLKQDKIIKRRTTHKKWKWKCEKGEAEREVYKK